MADGVQLSRLQSVGRHVLANQPVAPGHDFDRPHHGALQVRVRRAHAGVQNGHVDAPSGRLRDRRPQGSGVQQLIEVEACHPDLPCRRRFRRATNSMQRGRSSSASPSWSPTIWVQGVGVAARVQVLAGHRRLGGGGPQDGGQVVNGQPGQLTGPLPVADNTASTPANAWAFVISFQLERLKGRPAGAVHVGGDAVGRRPPSRIGTSRYVRGGDPAAGSCRFPRRRTGAAPRPGRPQGRHLPGREDVTGDAPVERHLEVEQLVGRQADGDERAKVPFPPASGTSTAAVAAPTEASRAGRRPRAATAAAGRPADPSRAVTSRNSSPQEAESAVSGENHIDLPAVVGQAHGAVATPAPLLRPTLPTPGAR